MKVSTFLKGCVLAAVLLLVSTEAYAQLPVRTQTLQLLGSTSGIVTQNTPAVVTSYAVTWPAAPDTGTGTVSVLIGTKASPTQVNFSWQTVTNTLIDGIGTLNQIAYFADPNTIVSSVNFVVDPVGASITVGAGTDDGSIRLVSSGTGNPTVTINSNSTTAGTFNFPTYGAAGTDNVVGTRNTPNPAGGEIPVTQADGTVLWTPNPLLNAQRGSQTTTAGTYSQVITVPGTPVPVVDLDDFIIVSSVDGTAQGNLLQITAASGATFTVSSAGPFQTGERITWLWIAQ